MSFVEIFAVKSVDGFLDSGYSDSVSWRYATLCFFLGVVFTGLLDHLIQYIENRAYQKRNAFKDGSIEKIDMEMNPLDECCNDSKVTAPPAHETITTTTYHDTHVCVLTINM